MTRSGQEWQFHIGTDILWLSMAILHFLQTSSSQEWQFHISTHI